MYVNTVESSPGIEFGAASNWGNTNSFSTNLTPNTVNFLHVYGYDLGGVAGFLGEVGLSDARFRFNNNTQSLVTNTTDWRVYRDMFGGTPDKATGFGTNGIGPWGTRPNIAANATWIWTHDANADDAAYFSTTIFPVGPAVTITSPGTSVPYRPGESGVASIVSNHEGGIRRLLCTAYGSASGHLDVSFDTPQLSLDQIINFQLVTTAVPNEPYYIICHAENSFGVWGEKVLQLQVAE